MLVPFVLKDSIVKLHPNKCIFLIVGMASWIRSTDGIRFFAIISEYRNQVVFVGSAVQVHFDGDVVMRLSID